MIFEKILNNRSILHEKISAKISNFVMSGGYRYYNPMVGGIRGDGIRAFWWTGEKNFGDLITPALLKLYGYTPILSTSTRAQVAATGSILGMLGRDYSGLILGSGLLSDNNKIQFPYAKILALRGALTRDRLQADSSTPLGDPGLLACDILQKRAKKRFKLGVVPHYEDLADPKIRAIAQRNNATDVKIINVMRGVEDVLHDIDQCENIISSSLHGCVVADSFGISNRWVVVSERLFGKGFKFRDYYSALSVDRSPWALSGDEEINVLINSTLAPPKEVKNIQAGLRDAFGIINTTLMTL